MAADIPILNLYYLLSYAWDHYQPGEMQDVGSSDCENLENLLALMLATGLHQLQRQGIDRGYANNVDEVARLRGRIHLMESQRRQTHLAGRMVCSFDDLTCDVLHNQILRSTGASLLRHPRMTAESRRLLGQALKPFGDVEIIPLTSLVFRRVQLHRNNRIYRFLLSLCELACRWALPQEQMPGEHRLQDILRDEIVMHRLFEQFVRNFAARHFPEAKVGSRKVPWQVEADAPSLSHLPDMRTDVTLDWPGRKLIVDCKFYAEAMSSRYGTSKLISSNLYQLLAYLNNQAFQPGWHAVEGLLLYPTNTHAFDCQYKLLGHRVRAASLDLGQPWSEVRSELLSLLQPAG